MNTISNDLLDKLLSDPQVFAAMKSAKKGTVSIQYLEDGSVDGVHVEERD